MEIVYNQAYNIGFLGFERLHPFDSRKYGRAVDALLKQFGNNLKQFIKSPLKPVSDEDLKLVHPEKYLNSLKSSKEIAQILEIPLLKFLPSFVIDRVVLKAMRWAVAGTVLASELALTSGAAVNMSGGYHHAGKDHGEGFCVYSDIGVAVASLKARNLLKKEAKIAIIDLDAHQGNGFERVFMDDGNVFIYDLYNQQVYPNDRFAQQAITVDLPIIAGTGDEEYITLLKQTLPDFLEQIGPVDLVYYNAGTDILKNDPLGRLNVSASAILTRDQLVIDELYKRKLNVVTLLSGGYTKESYQLVAAGVAYMHEKYNQKKHQ